MAIADARPLTSTVIVTVMMLLFPFMLVAQSRSARVVLWQASLPAVQAPISALKGLGSLLPGASRGRFCPGDHFQE